MLTAKIRLIALCLEVVAVFFSAGESSSCGQELSLKPIIEDIQESSRLITISEGIGLVLKDSRLLKISLTGKDMAFADSLIARSALLPQVKFSLSESFLTNQPGAQFGRESINTGQRQSFSYGFDVYQTLFDFGKSFSNYQAAKGLLNAQNMEVERVRKIAVLEFVIAYFNLLESEKMIGVAQIEVENLQSYLSDVEHLFEQGAATKNELLPAKVKLADAKQRLIVARNERSTAALRLNNILALPLRERIRVEDVLMDSPKIPVFEEAWKTAHAQRPEIKIITDELGAAILSEKAKRAQNLPTLYADGGYSYSQNEYQVHEDNVYLNLGAKLNLFDGGMSLSEALKEHYRQRQLVQQRDKLIEDIKFEIEDSYLSLKDASEKVLVNKDALGQAAENVRVTRVKYTEGAANTTDVLEAITLETGAQTNYYNSEYELKRNYAKLLYSMGIDLSLFYGRMINNGNK
jgi:outer membrane protein